MPNWCNNNVTISGPEKKLKALSKAAEGGEHFNFMYPRSKDLDITAGFVGPDDSAEQKELVRKQEANEKKHGYKDWYDWSVNCWGTKWDIGECYQNEIKDGVLHLAYDTAWSPPLGVYEHYLAKNDDVQLTAYYFEGGCDFMGCWDNGYDECFTISETSDSDLEHGSLSVYDDFYNILEHRHQYRDELIEDGRFDEAKEWLMNHAQMSEEDANDYINEHRIERGLEQMEVEGNA